ncbi:MAG: hypothetical protein WAW73_01525 [Rhodoferax sp.]
MRILSYLTTILFSLLLAACGGGGGSPGLSSGSVSTFSVVAPAAVTLQVGLLQQYAVQGGVKPYSVFSDDPAVAVGWIGGDDVLYVGTIIPGTAKITTTDAKGSKFDITVKSGSSTAFYMTAASSMTITPGAAYAQTFTLGGGTGPYTATSNFPSVATVSVNGNQMTITGVQISATTATITVRDAAGATLTSAVTVGTVPLAVNPTSITAFIGDKLRAIVTGGTRPYRVQTSIDESGLNAQIVDGNIVEVVGGQVATNAGVTIIDANNQSVTLGLTLTAGQDVLRVQPNAMTLPESATTPDITLMVYGASATGGLQVFTSNTSVLSPGTPVKNSDGTGYAVKLTGGNTCSLVAATDRTAVITVMDAKGKVGTSTITIKDYNGVVGC